MKTGEILKDRAEAFFENAKYLLKKRRYDLCAFNLEQAIQLYLKYYIWKKIGDFEKTHNIEKVLNTLKNIYPQKSKEIKKLIDRNKDLIDELEIVYIESRYIPVEIPKKRVKEFFDFTNKLLKILKNL